MAQSSSSTKSYEVFLSFRGKDTRLNFTDHTYHALRKASIRTFRDKEELKRGEKIEELFKAIKRSRISILVFSENYASSTWCLRELAKIMECKETDSQIVLPVFYKVEPHHVRNQTGSFAEAFVKHEKEQPKETVNSWRKAMREAGNLKGWDTKDPDYCYEANLINSIIAEVLSELNKTILEVAKHPVGIDFHVEEVLRLLDVQSKDVKFVGIHGMGGIGKTTIAMAVFNRIYRQFEGSCFLPNVRERASQCEGLVQLQKSLVFDILNGIDVGISGVAKGISVIKERCCDKKFLIVLDDVDHDKQLDALAGGHDWFGSESRIIITSRDKRYLNVDNRDKNKIYEPKEMDINQSLQLFNKHAFSGNEPQQDLFKLSIDVVRAARGLPLALVVLGSHLRDKTGPADWESELKRLNKTPHVDIQEILKVSFDGLEEDAKVIFLDIACFFIGNDEETITYVLEDYNPTTWIKVLVRKSLLKINKDNKLTMHDLLRDMGREIVRQEDTKNPGKRSRLWSHKEAMNVLEEGKGTSNVEGLQLSSGYPYPHLKVDAFKAMSELRLLQIDRAYLHGKFDCFPRGLKWLRWRGLPEKCIPTISHLRKLAVLDMSESMITENWSGWQHIQLIKTLKVLDLSHCDSLSRTPDFSSYTSLERLILDYCLRLVAVHESIGHLKKLVFLSLKYCTSLKELPNGICKLSSVKSLILFRCHTLEKLPKALGPMQSLTELIIVGTAIKELPDSIGSLEGLERLSARFCKELVKLPHSMGKLRRLHHLDIMGTGVVELPKDFGNLARLSILDANNCSKLQSLPELPSSLIELHVSKCVSMKRLPNLSNLKNLSDLSLYRCKELVEIQSINGLTMLHKLDLKNCRKLQSLSELPSSLTTLDASECISMERLPNLSNLKNLRDLLLGNCEKLAEIQGINGLTMLHKLDLTNCKKLQSLSELPSSLTTLDASGCISMERLPNLSNLKNLRDLFLVKCNKLAEIQGINGLTMLQTLDLMDCKNLLSLSELPLSLTKLVVRRCVSLERLPNMSNLKNLRDLFLDNCEKLAEIQGIKGLTMLHKLDLTNCKKLQSLSELPSSLTTLDAHGCISMERLPNLSNLKNLRDLFLGKCEKLAEIQGINGLTMLQTLDLIDCENLLSLSELPLSLTKLVVRRCISLERLPNLSNLKNLRDLLVANCEKLAEIQGINGHTMLHKLDLTNCKKLQSLSELPSSLTTLDASGCISMERLPNLSNLKNLRDLFLDNCEKLAEIQGINGLTMLHKLDLMDCKNLLSLSELPLSLTELVVRRCISMERLPNLSNLENLRDLFLDKCEKLEEIQGINGLTMLHKLDLTNCKKLQSLSELPSSLTKLVVRRCISMERLPNLSNLKNLRELQLVQWEVLSEIPGVSGLSLLQELHLQDCRKLQSLPELPSSLIILDAICCSSIERFPDLSNLKKLKELRLECCGNLSEIQGLEGLESLIFLRVIGCHTYINTLQKNVAQGKPPSALYKHGGELRKQYQIPDDDNINRTDLYLVYKHSGHTSSSPIDQNVFSIEAKIRRQDGKEIQCLHDLRIEGMTAETNEHQFYSCYFQGLTWFGFPLKMGDVIDVIDLGFLREGGLQSHVARHISIILAPSWPEVERRKFGFVRKYEAMAVSYQGNNKLRLDCSSGEADVSLSLELLLAWPDFEDMELDWPDFENVELDWSQVVAPPPNSNHREG